LVVPASSEVPIAVAAAATARMRRESRNSFTRVFLPVFE
jgi:hypothetical protein